MVTPTNIIRADFFHKKDVGLDKIPTLISEIYNYVNMMPSVENTNDNCWRSSVRFENIDWLLDEVIALVNNAVGYYKSLDPIFNKAEFKKPYKINYWTNVNKPGSRNVLHSHNGSHFACVYYVQAQDTGALRMINPANLIANCIPSAPYVRDFYFNPSAGDLILWPGWMPHEVEPNLSNKDRINIVFDIIL